MCMWKPEVITECLLYQFLSYFWRSCFLAESGACWMARLASIKQAPVILLSLPWAGITGSCCYSQPFPWELETKLSSLSYHGKPFTNRATAPAQPCDSLQMPRIGPSSYHDCKLISSHTELESIGLFNGFHCGWTPSGLLSVKPSVLFPSWTRKRLSHAHSALPASCSSL